ncbi:transposase [Paraburkholderia sp. WC7.3b]|uniref:Transposase n=1 Tax=Paraburkholderia podalyriae TaxID=1938811 RepID=A0ABR7Q1Y0_9BURK|nr:transposase [Paraburkholderia podalyriae]
MRAVRPPRATARTARRAASRTLHRGARSNPPRHAPRWRTPWPSSQAIPSVIDQASQSNGNPARNPTNPYAKTLLKDLHFLTWVDWPREGVHVGRKRVARLMRLAGLCGVRRRRWPAPRGSTRVRGARPIRCAGNSARKRPTYCGWRTPPIS